MEFVVLRVGSEMNDGLRYKLSMMGVLVKGPTNVYCDNEAVVSNSSLAELALKKHHLSVCYHKVRECYAKDAVLITYKPTAITWLIYTQRFYQQKRSGRRYDISYIERSEQHPCRIDYTYI